MKKSTVKSSAVNVAECAVFVALMTAGANLSIPFFPVPLTFQTVISVLAGLVLGWRKGALSMASYMFAGLVGLPVFTNFSGGIYYVLKPTFGYVLGFVFSALTAGIIVGKSKSLARFLTASIVAFFINYAVGIPYFAIIWQYYMHSGELGKYIVEFNLLYMPKDFLLCVLAAFLAKKIVPALTKEGKTLKNKGGSA